MRQTKAKGVAFGTGALILSAVALFAVLQQADSAPASGDVAVERVAEDTEARAPGAAEGAGPEPTGEASPEASGAAASEAEPESPREAEPESPEDGPEAPEEDGPESPREAGSLAQVPDSVLAAGREVYEEQDCSICHSIAGEGSPRYPLDGVGSRLDADEIRLWIVDPQEAQPGVRKPAFDDLPESEVDALVAYLQSLTDE